VGILFEKVMLDFPRVVDAQPIGEGNLVKRITEHAMFVAVLPRPRELVFVEDAESHGAPVVWLR
jgi:hypothetical protein